MTVGSWNSGSNYFSVSPTLNTFSAEKTWSGADGFVWGDGDLHRGPPWHTYTMTHRQWMKTAGDKKLVLFSADTPPGGQPVGYAWPLPPSPNLGLWDSRMELALLSKLSKKVKGHDFHIGVALAEVDKTASMVTNTLGNITRGVWELTRGNVPGAFRAWGSTARKVTSKTSLRVKDISGKFLEARYGWTPLLQDAYSSAKAFEQISNGPRGVTVKAGKRFILPVVSQNPQGVVRQVFGGEVRRTYTYEYSEELNALRSMGLLDPLSIVWERLPWSFVIDWFVPIGTYLDLLGVIPFLQGRFLRTTSGLNFFDYAYPEYQFPGVTIGGIPPFEGSDFKLERAELFSLSVPFPTVHTSGAVHGRRVGNAIALAHQMFDRALGFKQTPSRLRHGAKFDATRFQWPLSYQFD